MSSKVSRPTDEPTDLLGALVHVNTSDGIRLDGFLASSGTLGKVWIIVHGVNGNFYSSTLLSELAATLRETGNSILLINTRGHDILSFNTGESPCRVGSQIETLHACHYDLRAWQNFCLSRGFQEISILGHSLGALKACIWATHDDCIAKRLVLISPPRLNTQMLLDDPARGPVFREHLQDAVELCAAGSPDRVMKVRFPLPMWICASTYVDKYGSGKTYDYTELLEKIDIPCLWTFGESEVRRGTSNFRDADLILKQVILDKQKESIQSVRVVEKADHSYRDARPLLMQTLLQWNEECRTSR